MTPNPEQSERLLELAARCEAAEGPDRELDAEIALAGRVESYEPRYNHDIERDRRRELNERIAAAVGIKATVKVGHEVLGNERWVPARLPDYLTSLDAAMTLVPEGWVFNVGNDHRRRPVCWAHIWENTPEYDGQPSDEGRAATPALALTAAALRARAGDGA